MRPRIRGRRWAGWEHPRGKRLAARELICLKARQTLQSDASACSCESQARKKGVDSSDSWGPRNAPSRQAPGTSRAFAGLPEAHVSGGCVCPKGNSDNAKVVEETQDGPSNCLNAIFWSGTAPKHCQVLGHLGPRLCLRRWCYLQLLDTQTRRFVALGGQWKGNLRHGFGIHVEADGSTYEGLGLAFEP